jgi:threonine/homoserine/homoserine lactone efflux protein
MSADQLLAFCMFALIASITPGPNNMMIMASGLNHGFVRSLPHLAGICCGFVFMVFATGVGMHAVFDAVPQLQVVLKYVGAAWMVWLAWKLANAAPMGKNGENSANPMSFIGAAAFQWVNPKAWVMSVGAVTSYLPHASELKDVITLAVIFGVIGTPCVGIWASFGVGMQRVLQQPRAVRIFNFTMAGLLLASLYPVLVE